MIKYNGSRYEYTFYYPNMFDDTREGIEICRYREEDDFCLEKAAIRIEDDTLCLKKQQIIFVGDCEKNDETIHNLIKSVKGELSRLKDLVHKSDDYYEPVNFDKKRQETNQLRF